jgi:hypothetical protein
MARMAGPNQWQLILLKRGSCLPLTMPRPATPGSELYHVALEDTENYVTVYDKDNSYCFADGVRGVAPLGSRTLLSSFLHPVWNSRVGSVR